jgi:hypothetical protein
VHRTRKRDKRRKSTLPPKFYKEKEGKYNCRLIYTDLYLRPSIRVSKKLKNKKSEKKVAYPVRKDIVQLSLNCVVIG